MSVKIKNKSRHRREDLARFFLLAVIAISAFSFIADKFVTATGPGPIIVPAVVEPSNGTTVNSFEHHNFYAQGMWWDFYLNNTAHPTDPIGPNMPSLHPNSFTAVKKQIVYRTSSFFDAGNWSTPSVAFDATNISGWLRPDDWLDQLAVSPDKNGTQVGIAFHWFEKSQDEYGIYTTFTTCFRRGNLSSTGSVAWDPGEYLVDSNSGGNGDSNITGGYVQIGWTEGNHTGNWWITIADSYLWPWFGPPAADINYAYFDIVKFSYNLSTWHRMDDEQIYYPECQGFRYQSFVIPPPIGIYYNLFDVPLSYYMESVILPDTQPSRLGDAHIFIAGDDDASRIVYLYHNITSYLALYNQSHTLLHPFISGSRRDKFTGTEIPGKAIIAWVSTGNSLYSLTYNTVAKSWGYEVHVADNADYISASSEIGPVVNKTYIFYQNTNTHRIMRVMSTDGGLTWGTPEDMFHVNYPALSGLSSPLSLPPQGDFGVTWTESGSTVYHGSIGLAAINASISDMEGCGNWIFADTKYYHMNATFLRGYGQTIDTMQAFFTDGINSIYLNYDAATQHWSTTPELQNPIVGLRIGSVHGATSGAGTNYVSAIFEFYPTSTLHDYFNVDIWIHANTTSGLDTGWVDIAPHYFNIYSKGGALEYLVGGVANNAGYVTGGDAFELYASNWAWIAVNQTWRNLQQYEAQFTIRLFKNESGTYVGDDQLWQDYAHSGEPYKVPPIPLGTEDYTDSGDWKLNISMWYCDPLATGQNLWVKGWTVEIFMASGDIGANDYWTMLNVTWFQKNTKIKSDLINAYIERNPEAKIRLWVDMWFNQINASSVGGGRINAYYLGMRKNVGWLGLWGDWNPMQGNETHSSTFTNLLSTGNVLIHSTQIKLMKIGYILSRYSGLSQPDFMIETTQFDISEVKLAKGQMEGITTPVFVDPKVPDMPNEGFWAPLIAAVNAIGSMIMQAFAWLGQQVWSMLKQYVPWFTDFWEWVYSAGNSLFQWFGLLWGYFAGFLNFIAQGINLIVRPLNFIAQVFSYLAQAWNLVFGANAQTLAVLVFIFFVCVIFTAIDHDDWGFLIRVAQTTWRVFSNIIHLAITIVNMMVDLAVKMINMMKGWL